MSFNFSWLCSSCGKQQRTNEGSKVLKIADRKFRICKACVDAKKSVGGKSQ